MGFSIAQRLKAARQLAGFSSVEGLAKELAANKEARNLGAKTIRGIEQGHRTADAKELYAIAAACNLPLAWFSADFSRLDEISEDPRRVIAQETAEAVLRSRARRSGTPADPPPQSAEDLGS